MPSRSEAQRRKMALLWKQGKISDEEWRHFKRIVRKKPKKSKRKAKR